jgi:hypothetical protein
MKKKVILTVIILLQSLLLAHGQKGYKPGYIITNDFDTIRGFIKLKPNMQNSKSCEFIRAENQPPEIFLPNDLKAYRIENSKYYWSREIELDSVKQRVFLEYLIDGIVDLYYYKDIGREYYFIEKDSKLIQLSNEGSLVTLKEKDGSREIEKTYYKNSNQFQNILKYLFQDSPEVMKEIPSTTFDYRPLINITEDYHNSVCKDYKCIDFTKSTKQGIYMEPFFGGIGSWMGLKTSSDYAKNFKPYLGLQLRFKPFKGYSMWNLLTGISYSQNSFNGVFDNTINEDYYIKTYKIFYEYSIVRIPFTIEYSLSPKKLQPYISASYNNILILNESHEVTRMDVSFPYIEESYARKYQFGVALGLGLRYNMNSKSYIFLKNEFEYRVPAAKFGWILDHTMVYSDLISFGCGFKIK